MNSLAVVQLSVLDWGILVAFFAVSLGIGVWASKTAGGSTKEFFLGGQSMPWWLLGVSMVATTFSTDTPNVVANFVRNDGVAKNWEWWGFLLSGMLTVFVFAKLWRRSNVMTDVEFYEMRFSGKSAAFLRGFRALYLGLGFNVVIMGAVSLAAVKFGEIVLGVPGWQTLLVAGVVTLIYSSLGGLKGVIWTDFVQFVLAMIGSVWAMFYILDHESVQGIETLLAHPAVQGKTSMFPDFSDPSVYIPIFLIPIAVQWWASYYPGAEPGGGGYVVQRMLSAKDEKNALAGTFFFNLAHYALRPWPWILIALASLVLVPMKIDQDYGNGHLKPDPKSVERVEREMAQTPEAYSMMLSKLENQRANLLKANDDSGVKNADRLITICKENPKSIEVQALAHIWHEKSFDDGKKAYKESDYQANPISEESLVHMFLVNPEISIDKIGQDAGYPTMLKLLPSGLIGLVAASLIAAYMSTMSTQVNLGASYIVNDFYARFINPNASDHQLVNGGRIATVVMLLLGSILGLMLESADQAFKLILLIGAGTGLVYILRWFWWRVNAISEIVAMVFSLIVSLGVTFVLPKVAPTFANETPSWVFLLAGTVITTLAWIISSYITKPTSKEVLYSFYTTVQPGGPGWKRIVDQAAAEGKDIVTEKEGWDVPTGILATIFGSIAVYTALFAMGAWIYSDTMMGIIYTGVSVVSFVLVAVLWKKIKLH